MRTRGVRSLSSILRLSRLVGNSYSSMVMSPRTSSDIVEAGVGTWFKGSSLRSTGLSEYRSLAIDVTWCDVTNAGTGRRGVSGRLSEGDNVRWGCARRATAGIGRKGSVAMLSGYGWVERWDVASKTNDGGEAGQQTKLVGNCQRIGRVLRTKEALQRGCGRMLLSNCMAGGERQAWSQWMRLRGQPFASGGVYPQEDTGHVVM